MRQTSLMLLAMVVSGCFTEGVEDAPVDGTGTGPVDIGMDTPPDESSDGSSGPSAGESDDTGVDSGADTSGQSAPVILSLSVDPPSITMGESVVVSALVSDADGDEDIVGGSLATADGSRTYGPFALERGGVFETTVSWDTAAEISAFTFVGDGTLTLTATFFDAGGATVSESIGVGLHCEAGETSPAVCGDGLCVDFDDDADHCGACGNACEIQAEETQYEAGGCSDGTCQPLWDETCIVQSDPWSTCDEYCQDHGMVCTPTCGDEGARARFLTLGDCEDFGVGAFSDLCDFPLDFGGGDDAYRCCCA